MARSNPLFVGGFDRHDDLAVVGGNDRCVAGIGIGVQRNATHVKCQCQARALTSAEKPMVVATLLSPCMAHKLAPLPRWATMVRPRTASPWCSDKATARYSHDRP